jgi:hypothetical protein
MSQNWHCRLVRVHQSDTDQLALKNLRLNMKYLIHAVFWSQESISTVRYELIADYKTFGPLDEACVSFIS